jgi:hypothetical protein
MFFLQKKPFLVFMALISVFLQGFLSYNGVREDVDGRGVSVDRATHKPRNDIHVCRQPFSRVNALGSRNSFVESKNCPRCGRRKGSSHFVRVKKSRRPSAPRKSRGRLLRRYDRCGQKSDPIEPSKRSEDVPEPLLKRLNGPLLEIPLLLPKDNTAYPLSREDAPRKSRPVVRVVPRQRSGGGLTAGQGVLNAAAQNNQSPGSDDFLDGLDSLSRPGDRQVRVPSPSSFSDDALSDLSDLFNESDAEADNHSVVSDAESSSDSDFEELESSSFQQDTLFLTQPDLSSGSTLTGRESESQTPARPLHVPEGMRGNQQNLSSPYSVPSSTSVSPVFLRATSAGLGTPQFVSSRMRRGSEGQSELRPSSFQRRSSMGCVTEGLFSSGDQTHRTSLDQNGSLPSSSLASSVDSLISVAPDPEERVGQAFAFLSDYGSSDDGGDIPSELIHRTSTPVCLVTNSAEGERSLSGGTPSNPEIVSPIDSPVDALSRQNSSSALSVGNDFDRENIAAMQDATERYNVQGGRPELTTDSERMRDHLRLDLAQGSTDFLRGSSASFGGVSSLRNRPNFASAGSETFLRTTSLPDLTSRSSSLNLSESVSPRRQPSEQSLSSVLSGPDSHSAGSVEHLLCRSQDSLMSASGLEEFVRDPVQGLYPSRLENVVEAQMCWSTDCSMSQSSSEPSLNATLQTRPRDDSGLGDSQGHLLTPDALPRIRSQETLFKPSTSSQNDSASEADQVLLAPQGTHSQRRDSESSSSEVDIEEIGLEFDDDFDLERLQNNNPLPTFDSEDDESDQSFDDEWRYILQAAGQGMPDGNLRLLEEGPDQDDWFRREGSLTGYESQDDGPEMPGCSGTAENLYADTSLESMPELSFDPIIPVPKSPYLKVRKYRAQLGNPRKRRRAQPENRPSLSIHNDPEENALPTTSSSSPRRMRRRSSGVRSATPTTRSDADYGSSNAQRRRSLQDERDRHARGLRNRGAMRGQSALSARDRRLKEAQERVATHTRNRHAEAAERRRQNEAGRAIFQRGDQAAQDAATRRRQAYLEEKRQRAQRSQRRSTHIPGEAENNSRPIAARPLGRSPEEEVS